MLIVEQRTGTQGASILEIVGCVQTQSHGHQKFIASKRDSIIESVLALFSFGRVQ